MSIGIILSLSGVTSSAPFQLSAFLVTIASLAAAVLFFAKSQRRRRPCWAVRSNNLILDHSARVAGLEIRYNDAPVSNLTVTRLIFWNAGAETIMAGDVVEPIRIVPTEGINILDEPSVVQTNNPASQLEARFDESGSILLLFKYLDGGHGAVLDLIHSGIQSDDLDVKGVVVGCGEFDRKRIRLFLDPVFPIPSSWNRKFGLKMRMTMTALPGLAALIPVILLPLSRLLESEKWTPLDSVLVVTICIPILITLALAWAIASAPGIPRGLERFEEDI